LHKTCKRPQDVAQQMGYKSLADLSSLDGHDSALFYY
jgi:hypothetical protein